MAVKKDKEKEKLHKENKYMYISQAWSRTTVRQAVGLQTSHSDLWQPHIIHTRAIYAFTCSRKIKIAWPLGLHHVFTSYINLHDRGVYTIITM